MVGWAARRSLEGVSPSLFRMQIPDLFCQFSMPAWLAVVPLPAVPAPSGFLPCIPSFPSWSGPCAGLRWLARGESLARLLFTAVQYSCLSGCQAFQVSFGSPLGCCQKAEGQAACHGYRPRPHPLSRLPRCLSWELTCSASSPPFPSSIETVSQNRIVHELC